MRALLQRCLRCRTEPRSCGFTTWLPLATPFGTIYSANITPDVATGIGSWSRQDFYRVFREGKKPDGSAVDTFMPWQAMGKFSDTELEALWTYVRSVPARPLGQR